MAHADTLSFSSPFPRRYYDPFFTTLFIAPVLWWLLIRIKLEREAREIQSRLLQANKMTALGLMVSGGALEINNPNNLLLDHFLEKGAETFSKPKPAVSQQQLTALSLYGFPGNIRELEALVLMLLPGIGRERFFWIF